MTRNTSAAATAANLPRLRQTGAIIKSLLIAARSGELPTAVANREYQKDAAMRAAVLGYFQKDDVSGHSGSGPGSELGADPTSSQFTVAVSLQTAFGKFRPAPPGIPLEVYTSGIAVDPLASTLSEGQPIRVSAASFTKDKLPRRKHAVLLITTEELLRHPGTELALAVATQRAIAREINSASFDPTRTGSLTNGANSFSSSGADGWQTFDYDMQLALAAVSNANFESLSWVAGPEVVQGLAGLRNAVGGFAYPNVNARTGGELLGVPLVSAIGLPTNTLTLVDSAEILLGRENVQLAISRNATVEMDSEPTGEVITPTGQTKKVVGLFQVEGCAFRVLQVANWRMRRPNCIAVITGFAPRGLITT